MTRQKWVDVENHLLSPKIFSDEEIYREEQENIFMHSWLFIGHEQQLDGGPGSFITTYMGEDGVVACRDRSNNIRVFLNSCPHRGMKLCLVDHGKVKRFQCPFHAWTFNLEGELVAIPNFEEGYSGALDRSQWGMIEVPRVEVYRGLIFASFDPEIESFTDYLGDAKWYLDLVLNKSAQGTKLAPGVHKWSFNSNWKTIADNLAGDNAHVAWTHESIVDLAGGAIDFGGVEPWTRSFLTRTDKGHGFIVVSTDDSAFVGPATQRYRETSKVQTETRLTPVQNDVKDSIRIGTIFPNFSFLESFGYTAIRVHHPRGAGKTETWTWMLAETDMPEDTLAEARNVFIQQLSPSGIIESDDSEMWIQSQKATSATYRSRFPLNYQMGMGNGRVDPDRPGLIHRPPSEIGSFGFYEQWQKCMDRRGVPA